MKRILFIVLILVMWALPVYAFPPTPPSASSGAPSNAYYYVTTANGTLSNEVVLSSDVQAVLDDANMAAMRTTLGLGSAALLGTAAVGNGETDLPTGDHVYDFCETTQGYYNSGDNITAGTLSAGAGGFGVDADGDTTVKSLTTAGSSTPGGYWKDDDCTDDDVNFQIVGEATDTGSNTEDIDVEYKHQEAGALVTYMLADADGSLELGRTGMPVEIKDTLQMPTNTAGLLLVADGTDYEETSFVETELIPIGWAIDGASAPDALETITSGTDKAEVRTFSASADEDVVFTWQVPLDCDVTSGIKFRVICFIYHATGPSGETWQFELQGFSMGDGDPLDGTLGTAQTSNSGSRTDAQYDRVATAWSSAMTSTHITDLAVGETVEFKLYRDVDDNDDYGQVVGAAFVELKYKRLLNVPSF